MQHERSDSECLHYRTSFDSAFEYIYPSGVFTKLTWLRCDWYHAKLLLFRCTFCVHHNTPVCSVIRSHTHIHLISYCMFFSVSVSLCFSLSLSDSVSVSLCLSPCLSVCLSLSLSVCLSVSPFFPFLLITNYHFSSSFFRYCFHNPSNTDMHYRIFNVRMCSFCMRIHTCPPERFRASSSQRTFVEFADYYNFRDANPST